MNAPRRLPAPLTPRGGLFFTSSAAAAVFVLFLLLPFVGLVTRLSPGAVLARLGDPAIREALGLSLVASGAATLLVVAFGLPLAYLLATRDFPGKRWVEVLVQMPMVLPPTVAGFALLMAFGRAGIAGRWLDLAGISLPFSTLGVVVAQAFMAAPFFVTPARAGFASVDPRYLETAATLGAGEGRRLARVMLPIAAPSLLAGLALCAARALGEFGATITFAGNFPGVTRTMPLAVYGALQSDLDVAAALSVLLVIASFLLLFGLRLTGEPWGGGSPGARDPRA